MKKTLSKPSLFAIGGVVYILGKYFPSSDYPVILLECKISHIKYRQFVAYSTDGEPGEWRFSNKDYNKCVFLDKDRATEALNRNNQIRKKIKKLKSGGSSYEMEK